MTLYSSLMDSPRGVSVKEGKVMSATVQTHLQGQGLWP